MFLLENASLPSYKYTLFDTVIFKILFEKVANVGDRWGECILVSLYLKKISPQIMIWDVMSKCINVGQQPARIKTDCNVCCKCHFVRDPLD